MQTTTLPFFAFAALGTVSCLEKMTRIPSAAAGSSLRTQDIQTTVTTRADMQLQNAGQDQRLPELKVHPAG